MPCDQVRIVTMEIAKAKPDWIKQTAEALGLQVSEGEAGHLYFYAYGQYRGEFNNGGLAMADTYANTFKQRYTETVIRNVARQKGYTVSYNTQRQTLQLNRRG